MTDGKKKKESTKHAEAAVAPVHMCLPIPPSPSQGDPTTIDNSTGKCSSDASNGGPRSKDHEAPEFIQNKDKKIIGGGEKERKNKSGPSLAVATAQEVNGISSCEEVKNSPPAGTQHQQAGGGIKKGKNGKETEGKARNGKEEDINANEGTMEFEFATRTPQKSEKAAMDSIKKASKKKTDKYTLWVGGVALTVMAGFAIQKAFVPDAIHTEVNDPHYISILNSQNLGWKAGAIPAFDGLTVEDIRNLGSVTANSNSLCPSVEMDGPTHFDAREKWPNCFNHEVLTQRNCSSSWAIQIASTMGNRFCIGADEPEDYKKYLLSAQELLSCSMDNAGCQGGDMDAAFEYVMENGLVKEACFPFEGTDTVTCSKKCKKKKKASRASGVCVVDTVKNLKTELMLNGPLIVTMFIFNDVLLYKEGIYTPYNNANLLPLPGRKNQFLMHAVKLLGWGEENNVEYWLIENSFGPEWGTNGVGKIKRVSKVDMTNLLQASRQQVVVEFGMSITPRRLYFDEDEE